MKNLLALIKKTPLLSSTGLFVAILLVFTSLTPSINAGLADGDELITVAKIFGVAHPPGYPLYTVLAAAFGHMPLPATFAWKVNWLNGLYQTIAAFFIYLSMCRLIGIWVKQEAVKKTISALASVILVFTPSFLLYGTVTEVFSMNNAFAAAIFYLLTRWNQNPDKNYLLIIAAAVLGAGLSNQQIIILLLPAIAFWVLTKKIRLFFNGKFMVSAMFLCLVCFLTPYVYLPIAARNQTSINWEDPSNINGIYRSITRRVYAEVSPIQKAYLETRIDLAKTPENLGRFMAFLISEFGTVFFASGLLGIFFLIKKRAWRILGFLLLGIVGGGAFFSAYSPFLVTNDFLYYKPHLGIYQRFFLLSSMFWVALTGFGLLEIYSLVVQYIIPAFLSKKHELKIFSYLFLTIITFAVLISSWPNYQMVKSADLGQAHRFGQALLESLEPNAILLCYSEQTCFTGLYLQQVEGIRPDVLIVQEGFTLVTLDQFKRNYPGLIKTTTPRPNLVYSTIIIRDLIRWQIDKRPIYVSGIVNEDSFLSSRGLKGDPFFLVPYGCSMKVAKEFRPSPQPLSCQLVTEQMIKSRLPEKLPITEMIKSYVAYQHILHAISYMNYDCSKLARDEISTTLKLAPNYKEVKEGYLALRDSQLNCASLVKGPTLTELINKVAEVESKNDNAEALYYQNQATLIEPDSLSLRFKLAELYESQKAFDNAFLEYADILSLDPQNISAQKALKRLDSVFN